MSPKILVISLTRKGGGFEQYTNAILEHFKLPFTIYQSAFVSDEVRRDDAKFIVTYKGKISFILSSIFILPFIFLYFCLVARKYSALFVPHFHFFNIAFIVAFRLNKKPVILVEHDGIVHLGDELPMQQFLINLCIKNATHIIFLSNFVASQVSPKLLQNKPISIIPHGIFAFKGLKRDQKQYHPKPTLLFFGRVSKYKGIELLLDTLPSIQTQSYEKLIIAGKSNYQYSIAHLSSEVQEKIEIIDRFLSMGEIAEIFNSAHILIMPYLEASQSGVAAVGIANGMACVVSDVGGLSEQFILEGNSSLGGANSSCGDFLGSASRSFVNEPQSSISLLHSHNPKNSSTILKFADSANRANLHKIAESSIDSAIIAGRGGGSMLMPSKIPVRLLLNQIRHSWHKHCKISSAIKISTKCYHTKRFCVQKS
ncbi:glycosyltransferase family 4 protein [Helicobacter sp. 23-1044]